MITKTRKDPNSQYQAEALKGIANREIIIRAYTEAVSEALRRYGDHGPLVSGCVREHFPDDVKNRLRFLCREMNAYHDAAWRAWRQSGRRLTTFRTIARNYAEECRASNPLRHLCYYY